MRDRRDKPLASRGDGKSDAIESAVDVPLFCIHNKKTSGCVGNCVLLWRVCGSGYTVDLDEAWKMTKKQADDICRSRPKEDFPVAYELLVSLARRHVDIQGLWSALKAQKITAVADSSTATNAGSQAKTGGRGNAE